MTIARRSHGGKRGLPRTPLRLRHPCSPRPPSCPSLAPATLLNPSRPSGGSGTSQPAQSAALSKTEDNSLSAPLPAARTSPVAKTPREHGSRDGDGTRTPGLRGSAVPLGSAECAIVVPLGDVAWHHRRLTSHRPRRAPAHPSLGPKGGLGSHRRHGSSPSGAPPVSPMVGGRFLGISDSNTQGEAGSA